MDSIDEQMDHLMDLIKNVNKRIQKLESALEKCKEQRDSYSRHFPYADHQDYVDGDNGEIEKILRGVK